MIWSAYRAKRIFSLAGEQPAATLATLEARPAYLEDAVLLAKNGIIESVEPYAHYRRRKLTDVAFTDLGERCLAPGLVNAHCHLELSHLAGKVRQGADFGGWMQSLITALREPVQGQDKYEALRDVVRAFLQEGTVHVGDVGSRSPDLVAQAAAVQQPYPVTHFLEAFGFTRPDSTLPVPPKLDAEGWTPPVAEALDASLWQHCAIAGHALYSTGPEALQAALRWCTLNNKPFSLHLAESEEEDACLVRGEGLLYELLRRSVLPKNWKAPGLRPVPLADHYGLLSSRTLAVHCVRCTADDAETLGRHGVSVCLCPNSNAYIGVGTAPAGLLARSGVVLCLGTDSAASNTRLSLRDEMLAAEREHGFSPWATLRMASINGAHALELPHLGSLEKGRCAAFSLWDTASF